MTSQPRPQASRGRRSEAGQSLIILVVAFFALIAIIGLAIDLGLMYIERIQLGRACDAAALAAAQELPFEDFAAERAKQYLMENGYDPTNTELIVLGPIADLGWAAPANSRGTITINTERFENTDLADPEKSSSADKILVNGRINVPMYFMTILGFRSVPVEAQAIAENVNNVDVAVVYDRSGSMEFDTRCYGCYEANGSPYPGGDRNPLPYPDAFCGESSPVVYNDYTILVSEAELFTYSTSYREHNYHREYYQFPDTYWSMQRQPGAYASGYRRATDPDDHGGANMMHMPFAMAEGHSSVDSEAPRLDYTFEIPDPSPRSASWYVWIRAQCGPRTDGVDACRIHWGVDGSAAGYVSSGDYAYGRCGDYAGACDGRRWSWIRLNNTPYTWGTDSSHTVNIWGGGPGARIDKVLVTNSPEGEDGSRPDRAPSIIRNTTPSWTSVSGQEYQSYYYSLGSTYYMGPGDTGGHTGDACAPCNPMYGLVENTGCTVGQAPDASCDDHNGNGQIDYDEICNNAGDDMLDDKQPIRASKEAAKNFVKRLKARYDQISFVTYNQTATIGEELMCIKQYGYPPAELGVGIWDFDLGAPDAAWTWCYDNSADGHSMLSSIEAMDSQGNTNIAHAMQLGIATLDPGGGHYGRPAAVKVMVLMTDGQANQYPSGTGCEYETDLWPDGGAPKDCVVFFARDAQNKNIVIYTIGLGDSADHALLREVADRTGGVYYFAPDAQKLDTIFQQIADQIFLRLIQ
jgi:hypothetical protein